MNKVYNILTICNDAYMSFGKLFILSAQRHLQPNKVNKYIVYNTGLSEENIQWFNDHNVIVIDTHITHYKFNKLHDDGWENIVYSKTKFLKHSLEIDPTPTIMIDVDCLFVTNIFPWIELFNSSYEFLVCRTTYGKPKYIGCFFAAIDIPSSLSFLDKWINTIPTMGTTVKESPALSKIILEEGINYRFGEIIDLVICAPTYLSTPDSAILHMKSQGPDLITLEDRITQSIILKHLKGYDL